MNDLDLYNACMNFSRVFGNIVALKSQLNSARLCFDEMNTQHLEKKLKYKKNGLEMNIIICVKL